MGREGFDAGYLGVSENRPHFRRPLQRQKKRDSERKGNKVIVRYGIA